MNKNDGSHRRGRVLRPSLQAGDKPSKPELKPRSPVSQCCDCNLFFTAPSIFDLHRYGDWDHRKCYTPAEMRQLGMEENLYGVWMKGNFKNPRKGKEKEVA